MVLRRRFGRVGKRSTGLIGATDVILEGRLTSGTLIAILRLTGAAAANFPAFSAPFLLPVAAFLLLAVVTETLLLLTFLVAPLVDVLVAVCFVGFPLLAVAAVFLTVFFLLVVVPVFFLEAAF